LNRKISRNSTALGSSAGAVLTSSILLLFLSSSLVSVLPPPNTALATHLYTGHKFFTTTPEYCISPSFSSSIKSAIKTGIADLNALPSKFTLIEEAWGSNCFSYFYPKSINPNYLAYTSTLVLGDPPHVNRAVTAYNTYYSWTGSLTCTNPSLPGPYNARATAHHELGHWVEMRHPSSTENTVMMFNFNCAYWASFKSHDSSTISAVYG